MWFPSFSLTTGGIFDNLVKYEYLDITQEYFPRNYKKLKH